MLARFAHGRSRYVICAVGVCALALLTAACGSSGTSSSASSSSGSSSFSSYLNCLRQHGVSVPTARPTGAPGGGFGGGGFGGGGSSTFEQARQACASLRPSGGFGGFGGFGGQFAADVQAFRSCMAAHGEAIPATRPTAPPASAPSGADRFLNGLDPSNPKVAAALKACESKLPSLPAAG